MSASQLLVKFKLHILSVSLQLIFHSSLSLREPLCNPISELHVLRILDGAKPCSPCWKRNNNSLLISLMRKLESWLYGQKFIISHGVPYAPQTKEIMKQLTRIFRALDRSGHKVGEDSILENRSQNQESKLVFGSLAPVYI